jgi:hypothetical protein
MSPEQIQAPGEVDHRADIYALGVVFYQMLTGELPGKQIEAPSKKVSIDVRLDEVVLRALEQKPGLRYQQASEVRTMVETIAASPEKSEIRSPKPEVNPECAVNPTKQALLWMLFNERTGRRQFNWPFLLLLCSQIGLTINGILLTIALVVWLVNVPLPAGKTFATPDQVWRMILWLAAFAVMRQVAMTALNLDSKVLGWSRLFQQTRPVAARTVIVFCVVFLTSAGLAGGMAFLSPWMHARCSTLLANVIPLANSKLARVVAWIVLASTLAWFIRRVWRQAKKPVSPLGSPIQKPDHFWRWFAVAVLVMIAVPILISIFGLLAAVTIPNFIRARAQSQANARHAQAELVTNQMLGPGLAFGPVVERNLQRFGPGATNSFLRVGNGEFLSPPTTDGPAFFYAWLTNNANLALDEMTDSHGSNCFLLTVFGMNLSDYPSDNWEAATPAEVKAALGNPTSLPHPQKRELANRTYILPEVPGLPLLAFSTADGSQGLLQITGYSEKPTSVRIRYKLVQKSEPAAYPGDWIWEPNSETLGRVPPIFLVKSSTLSANAAPFEIFGKDRYLARGKTLKELVATLWSQKNSALKIIYTDEPPEGKFDVIVTARPQWPDDLQTELDSRYHLVEQIENRGGTYVVLVKNVPQAGSYTLPPATAEDDSKLNQQPPVVVETAPASGTRDVPPGETEIRVRFSKPMTDGSWSWSTAWENSTPDFIGSPHYEADGRTCVAKVKLEPDRTYAFWLNSEKFLNFRDAENRPAVPYLLIFQTKQN